MPVCKKLTDVSVRVSQSLNPVVPHRPEAHKKTGFSSKRKAFFCPPAAGKGDACHISASRLPVAASRSCTHNAPEDNAVIPLLRSVRYFCCVLPWPSPPLPPPPSFLLDMVTR